MTKFEMFLYPEEVEAVRGALKALHDGGPLDAWTHLVELEGVLWRLCGAINEAEDRKLTARADAFLEAEEAAWDAYLGDDPID